MYRGSINKIIILNNIVIKIECINDLYTKNIVLSLDNNHKKYYDDLKKLKIDVAKLYYDKKIFGINFQIQEYIKGKTLASLMKDKKVLINKKIYYFKELLFIYRKTLISDISIDLNMKNFIIKDDKLIYVDLIPSIYKSKISNKNVENDEYKNYYLNTNLAICNLINYFFRSVIYLSKEELIDLLNVLKKIVFKTLKIRLDLSKNKKSNLIYEYLISNMSYKEYEYIYQIIKRK